MKMNRKAVLLLLVVALMAMMTACGGGESEKDYLSWSGTEWEAASEEEKTEALKAVMLEVQPELEENADNLDSTVEAMIPTFDQMFAASPDTTLQDLVEQMQNAMDKMENQAETPVEVPTEEPAAETPAE